MSDEEQGISVHKGFPNPATDQTLTGLDLQALLIKHPVSTFFMEIDGNEWEELGIFAGDIVLVDRALTPRKTDYVIWWDASTFVISRFTSIPPDTIVWGTVSSVVHRFRP